MRGPQGVEGPAFFPSFARTRASPAVLDVSGPHGEDQVPGRASSRSRADTSGQRWHNIPRRGSCSARSGMRCRCRWSPGRQRSPPGGSRPAFSAPPQSRRTGRRCGYRCGAGRADHRSYPGCGRYPAGPQLAGVVGVVVKDLRPMEAALVLQAGGPPPERRSAPPPPHGRGPQGDGRGGGRQGVFSHCEPPAPQGYMGKGLPPVHHVEGGQAPFPDQTCRVDVPRLRPKVVTGRLSPPGWHGVGFVPVGDDAPPSGTRSAKRRKECSTSSRSLKKSRWSASMFRMTATVGKKDKRSCSTRRTPG